MKQRIQDELTRIQEQGRLRRLRPLSGRRGCRALFEGRELLNLSSNDYLGLGASYELVQEFYSSMEAENLIDRYGLGSCSSRLLTGDCEAGQRLEERLASLYQRQSALLFNSGYHANIGIVPSLLGKGDLILSDKLNHASIHDGLNLCRARHKRFRHRDYDHLQAILERSRQDYDRVMIISESVFSMDGDTADLQRLVRIRNRFDAILYLDEAHGVGLYGDTGLGQAEEAGLLEEVDLLVGTFGKALGGLGAFVVCDRVIRETLINRSRSLIFTTALPPVQLSWNLFALEKIGGLKRERQRLSRLAERLRQALRERDLKTFGSTNIVPVILGDDRQTVRLAERLKENGYLILPVRPPAVPEGTARFRLSLTADMRWDDLRGLADCIAGDGGQA